MEALASGALEPPQSRLAIDRIGWQIEGLMRLLSETGVPIHTAVVEICSGQRGTGSRRNAGPKLAVYGMAAGAIYATCVASPFCLNVVPIPENVWTNTKGYKTKRQRQLIARGYNPDYDEDADTGADEADAIALMAWYERRLMMERLNERSRSG